MVSEQEISAAIGSTAYGSDGGKLGTVEAFFADDRTGAPTWVALSTGLFGTRHSVVPVSGATFDEGSLRIPVTADAVRNAPPMAGEHLDPADEALLRRHYGIDHVSTAPPAAEAETAVGGTGPKHAAPAEPAADTTTATTTDAPTTDAPAAVPPSDDAMTRSEEQLRVGTERVATTRARLVKYVVTENVQITVPIRREEIRVEHVTVDAEDGDGAGESLEVPPGTVAGGLPDEIVLHTERPVVTVEVVPVERVRLRTEQVEGHETVTEQVVRERIAVDETPSSGVSPR